jgi:para-nitrobenzyl esterase
MDRRHFISGASLAIGGAMASSIIGAKAQAQSGEPIVETAAGKVRGVDNNGIYTFKGIPYGASTAGKNRFMPPQKPKPWSGVKDCLDWGLMSPQPAGGTLGGGAMGREFGLIFGVGAFTTKIGEDCLVLNVFTPGLRDGKKRPVMVWIHGGGFAIGTGSGPRTDGTNLARNHDVVSVSLNHRLGVVGYCELGALDKDFEHSGNVGQLDLVAALEWVRDNIEAFGGDPNNVLIHGESGGGAKVSLLMAMPAAKGLFHRAICQSGVIIATKGAMMRLPDRAKASEQAEGLLKDAGLGPKDVKKLQQLPIDQLLAALTKTIPAPGRNFAPVLGTVDLPEDPGEALAKGSARIPFVIGSTKHEANFMLASAGVDPKKVTDEQLQQRAAGFYGEQAGEMIAGYRKDYPKYSAGEILVRLMTDSFDRFASIKAAEAHIKGGGGPTYMYLFTWESPLLPNMQACHGMDGGFYFGNTEALGMTKGNPDAQQLSAKASAAWASFARSGNPSTPALAWPEYTADKRATMIWASKSHVEDDPMGADRRLWEKVTGA